MKCPRCETTVLDERDRSGITVDSCPACRGVWLDRGELEKLMSREFADVPTPSPVAAAPPPPPPPYRAEAYPPPGYYRHDDDYRYRKHPDYYRKRKWKDLLGEIFD